ncbi:MAG TPA: hypothetical protein VLD39_16590 [Gammaproteobacteria bacterium]|nr:hypothetical protein [Gammaproteobacteria bacterium]
MRIRLIEVTLALGVVAVAAAGLVPGAVRDAAAQAANASRFPPYDPPRTADGRPDLNGIWQSLTTANWDIEAHGAAPGPHPELLGAWGAQPGGVGIVEGGAIPYQPWALERRRERFESRTTVSVPGDGVDPPLGDPELKCWMPGVPRSMYMPYPLQIVQTPEFLLFAHEFNGTARIVRMNWEEESPVDDTFFMGWSRAHWDGDTLVIDVTGLNEDNWLDRAGNFHSAAVHIVERLTLVSPYHLMYEATIDDPAVYTRPWKIRFPLYRRVEESARLMEFKCQPFVEELIYGRFTRTVTD